MSLAGPGQGYREDEGGAAAVSAPGMGRRVRGARRHRPHAGHRAPRRAVLRPPLHGVPDGYELDTFLSIVRAVAEGRSGLAAGSVARLRAVGTPLHLEVLH